jgi:hypothetical protein
VLPILWNTVRSFWIRHYLESLIPTEARKNTSLTVDPAAGVVIVILDRLELTWQDITSRWQHDSLVASKVQQIDKRLVGCSWMGIYEAILVTKIAGGSQRIVVDASLRFEPRGIHCDWQTFAFLALGLGVDPHRTQLQYPLEIVLTDVRDNPILSVRSSTDGSVAAQLLPSISYSQRRALAWFCVMIIRDFTGIFYIPLISGDMSQQHDLKRAPDATALTGGIRLLDNGISLESALTWICYTETIFYNEGFEELLPVPQIILKAREDALAELRKLTAEDLNVHLHTIFDGNNDIISKVVVKLHQAWNEAIPDILDGARKGRRESSYRTCQTVLSLPTLLGTSGTIRALHQTITMNIHRRQNNGFIATNNEPTVTGARIWLGFSIVQLARREDWQTELEFDGRIVAKPDSKKVVDFLGTRDEGLRNREIYIC